MILKLFGALCVVCMAGASFATEAPIAKLMQPSGVVEYSVKGATWRPAPRIKYLFEGYMIRTGEGGSAKLINQVSGMAQTLGGSSQIEIKDGEIHLQAGDLSKPAEDSTSIWQSILNKFSLAQKYTTVRRSSGACDSKVRTANVTVSPSNPELVWRNACPEFYYRLRIDDEAVEIPPQATAEMIRYSVAGLAPGVHRYKVEVLDIDGIIFSRRKASEFELLTEGEEARLNRVLDAHEGDVYMITSILAENNLHVEAMDRWRDYFQAYPDENDMRPLLAEAYARLRLENLQQREARLYQSQSVP